MLVLCMRCNQRIDDDPQNCTCGRSRVRAFETRAPKPALRPTNLARVVMTALALGPRNERELQHAMQLAAKAQRETN